jgi:hypothetical protein
MLSSLPIRALEWPQATKGYKMPILDRQDTGPIARLTLNAPEKLNALSDAMLAALQDQLDQLAGDNSIRVVTIAGAGKAFCAGHDLKEMTAGRQAPDGGRAYFAGLFDRCAARHCHRRRLSIGGKLRHGRRRPWHPLWCQWRQYRVVLLDPDGGA